MGGTWFRLSWVGAEDSRWLLAGLILIGVTCDHTLPPQVGGISALSSLLKGLPESLYKQYSYELPHINSGAQLFHSAFFQSLVSLATNLELDTLETCRDSVKWQWFSQYCLASRMCRSLQYRRPLPLPVARGIKEKVTLLKLPDEEDDEKYLNSKVFGLEHDQQLILWLQRFELV